MTKEAENQIRTMAQTSKSVIGHVPDFFPIHRHSIFHSCLNVTVTKLFWIDVRRTRRQPFNMNCWVFSQVRHHLFAPMNRGSVPYHYERPSSMPSQMFERFDNGFTIDRLVEMALIDSPRNRQPYSSRKHATAIGNSSQYGWLPTWSPGVSDRFKKRETHFIKKHDVSTDAPRFFLYAANHGEATLQPTCRLVRRHGALDTVDSSQVFSRNGSDNQDDRRHQTRV
jgi:hypothetical protein